jgi:hypothetical protein
MLLSGFVLAPSVARAQCGHYVVIGAGTMPGPHQTNDGLFAGSTATSAQSSLLGSSFPHRPCSGPGCKRAPVTPPFAPITPPPVIEKEWGHVTGSFLSGMDDVPCFLVDSSSERPLHRTNSIYHPPRLPIGQSP